MCLGMGDHDFPHCLPEIHFRQQYRSQFSSTSSTEKMSAIHVGAQEVSVLYLSAYCGNAAAALVVYDWLLCLSQEVKFMWNGHSKVTASLLVYAFSRYSIFTQVVLSIATNFPMSDTSCAAIAWTQTVSQVLGTIAFSAFSALRAYALSNRNVWSAATVVILMLPPMVLAILHCFYQVPANLPSPLNCSASNSLSSTAAISVAVGVRGSQLAAELLVIGITWWYSYQSYRLRKGLNIGNTVSSLLLYNGSLYFLFLASLYIVDIVLHIIPGAANFANYDGLLTTFYDPITSILVCRFMLSLRQFDATNARATFSMPGSLVRDPATLDFGAQPCETLPPFIASFAHPVHVDSALPDTDTDEDLADGSESEWRETDAAALTWTMSSYKSESASRGASERTV
ncbi:hypothetical protein V8D89_001173 [Ganoderma adspersum]